MAALLSSAVIFLVSLAVLLKASDVFTSSTEQVGLSLGISPFIIGATVVAGGTSLPELVSSVLAVAAGAPAIVVGNVVGSNVANIFLILGIAAVVGKRLRVNRELMRVDLPLLTGSAGFLLVTVWNGQFVWYEGVLALVGLAAYMHFTLSEEERLDEVVEELVVDHADQFDEMPSELDVEEVATEATVTARTALAIVASLVLVFLAADQLVNAILSIATELQIGAEFVAITAVSIGTSLPEIAVSIVAVRKGDVEIAVGNVLGSNIFNVFAVMAASSFVGPLSVPSSILQYALPVMGIATLLYYFITQDREITIWEGATLLLLYVVFLANLAQFV